MFPISVLTASALIHAIISALTIKYEFEVKWYDGAKDRRRKEPARSQYYRNRVARAERQAEGVILDIQDALGIPDVSPFPLLPQSIGHYRSDTSLSSLDAAEDLS